MKYIAYAFVALFSIHAPAFAGEWNCITSYTDEKGRESIKNEIAPGELTKGGFKDTYEADSKAAAEAKASASQIAMLITPFGLGEFVHCAPGVDSFEGKPCFRTFHNDSECVPAE